ncbi:MAG: hypothetical protein H7263_03070, partial [Candidatus Sericytochromatia bacterium]|nr:hypothetical protein [Candidatus Sericytochromatia bacterium]
QNKIQNFNKSNSEPKLLDFGIFDYKLDNARKQNEDKKDLEPINNKDKIDSNGNELKDLIDKITNSPDMQKELKNLTESFGNIGEALNHMAPGHIPYNGAIHSSDGDVGTEFFKKLQNIINSSH